MSDDDAEAAKSIAKAAFMEAFRDLNRTRCNASDGQHICTLYEGHPSEHSALGGKVKW